MEFDEQDMFGEGGDDLERGGEASSSDSDSPEETGKGSEEQPPRRAGGKGFSKGLARYAAAEAEQEKRAEITKPKLGTSMPIHIRQSPMRAAMKIEERDENMPHANTFVPLHDMDQSVDLSGKAASISNASVAKREQLLQRNKILRRTGFIESQNQTAGGATGVEPALSDLMDPLRMQPKRMIPIKEGSHMETSALSAALSPSPDTLHHRIPASLPRHTQLGF